jgi:hypothetical protein
MACRRYEQAFFESIQRSVQIRQRQRVKHLRERLRQHYRPHQVRLLFVGEAPPASGRFFYKANSGLYRAIQDVFTRVFPTVQNEGFLDSFCYLGCYLVDLCGTPVDRLNNKQREKARIKAEVRLSQILKDTAPKILINVVKAISINVRRALELADWRCVCIDLPYPGRWKHHRIEFERGLKAILRKEYTASASR